MLLPALLLFFLFLCLSAFFSSSETAFIAANPYKLDYLKQKGSPTARLISRMVERVDQLLATILIGNTLVNTAAASVATFIFVTLMPERKNQAVLLATVTTTVFILVFSEITPKTYAAHHPLELSRYFARPIRLFMYLFYPFVQLFTQLTRVFFPADRGQERREMSPEEIKILLTSGVSGLSTWRKKVVTEALDIGRRYVKEVMVPRPQVRAVEINSPLEEWLRLVEEEGYSRLPVYEKRLDNIMGTVHVKDLIPWVLKKEKPSLRQIIRPPYYIPESATLENVLRQMQATKNHLMYIVDEYGNFEGIVTLEDIIEEIVGEIQDEYDKELEELIQEEGQGVFLVRGRTPIKELKQRVPIDIPYKGYFTTVAGFFLSEFGQIPQEGDEIIFSGYRITVVKMSGRLIQLLRFTPEKRNIKSSDESDRHQ
ncbi:MAG: hypothetical protein DRI99_03210 [Candidatus Aminicenantes bacterium]|nr:MAG: hypothetical protein DRI99_03210 [Candidatus Aminicenantes bacterium]